MRNTNNIVLLLSHSSTHFVNWSILTSADIFKDRPIIKSTVLKMYKKKMCISLILLLLIHASTTKRWESQHRRLKWWNISRVDTTRMLRNLQGNVSPLSWLPRAKVTKPFLKLLFYGSSILDSYSLWFLELQLCSQTKNHELNYILCRCPRDM